MEDKKPIKIDFSDIACNRHSAQIEDKLYLDDNTERPETSMQHSEMSFPVQIDVAMIFICINGKSKLRINLHECELSRGSIAIILPNNFFQIISVSKDFQYAMMAITRSLMDHSGNVSAGLQFLQKTLDYPMVTIGEEELEEMLTIYKLLKNKLLTPTFAYKEEVAVNYLNVMRCNIFMNVIEGSDERSKQERPTSRKDEIFRGFLREVERNYTKERNVIFYANKLCVSPKYLSSVIHDVSGKYATQWIDEFVILECKTLLRSNKYTVKEICNHLNFANQSFFAKYFKQHTGFTPREYKNA